MIKLRVSAFLVNIIHYRIYINTNSILFSLLTTWVYYTFDTLLYYIIRTLEYNFDGNAHMRIVCIRFGALESHIVLNGVFPLLLLIIYHLIFMSTSNGIKVILNDTNGVDMKSLSRH